MIAPARVAIDTPDPLIATLELRHPIDAAVLKAAINYREALVDQLMGEIEVLKVTRARLLNEQPT